MNKYIHCTICDAVNDVSPTEEWACRNCGKEHESPDGLAGQSSSAAPCWAAGDTINFPPYRMVWKVEQVVERGLVISHIENGGHRHLVEWSRVAEGVRPNVRTEPRGTVANDNPNPL